MIFVGNAYLHRIFNSNPTNSGNRDRWREPESVSIFDVELIAILLQFDVGALDFFGLIVRDRLALKLGCFEILVIGLVGSEWLTLNEGWSVPDALDREGDLLT